MLTDPIDWQDIIVALFLTCASMGSLFALAAALLAGRYRPRPANDAALPAVTILKPMHGDEPALIANLTAAFAQDYPAPVQIIGGVRDRRDPALHRFLDVAAAFPLVDAVAIDNPRLHGANNKLSNLANMATAIRHPLVVIADSDVAWPPGTLRRLAAALAQPGVGIATCLHVGRGDAGFWSRVAAMDLSYRYMPMVMVGTAMGMAHPALGPTMALRRDTLAAIGGFAAFGEVLADDYEIGRAVRATGLRSVLPALFVVHGCGEASLAALVAHELRWSITIARIDPPGFVGSIITHAVPLALIGAAIGQFDVEPLAVLAVALAARWIVKLRIDAVSGHASGPAWLLPLRDVLSFAIFCASFAINKVDWRGAQFRVTRDGKLQSMQGTVP